MIRNCPCFSAPGSLSATYIFRFSSEAEYLSFFTQITNCGLFDITLVLQEMFDLEFFAPDSRRFIPVNLGQVEGPVG